MKKPTLGAILLAIPLLLLLFITPSCQTKARVDEINLETVAQIQQHNDQVAMIVAGKVNRWIVREQVEGRTPTAMQISVKSDEISRVEFAAASKREAEIALAGAKRATEAAKGLWGELAVNAPGAVAAAASGNPIGALLLLLGAGGTAYGVVRQRDRKYKPGEKFGGIPDLAASSTTILRMAREFEDRRGFEDRRVMEMSTATPQSPYPNVPLDDRGKPVQSA